MLRPYQEKSVNEIRELYKKNVRKVLLRLATGAGKTVIFCHILKAMAEKNRPAIIVVRGRGLVDQASQRLIREGVHHGVLMAGHWLYRPHEKIQVCSIDTLTSRGITPDAELVIIDEVHMATSKGYRDFLVHYDKSFILGVTATPYGEKSLRHVADAVVYPISFQTLVDEGFLVDARYFAPSDPDLSRVEISSSTHDYNQSQLSAAVDNSELVGDVVSHWQRLGENRPTVCFAVSIEHSKHIANCFNNKGISAEHCEADTPDNERVAILKRLKTGETKIVSNVGILCTGTDIPHLGCIIMARPTQSYNLYIQQAGRGTRPYENKKDFLLLDHAGNVLRHGFINEEPEVNLDGKPIKEKDRSPSTCGECYAVFYGTKCPACGNSAKIYTREREITEVEGELKELDALPFDAQVKRFMSQLKKIQKHKSYKRQWVYHKLKEKYGQEVAEKFYGKPFVVPWINRGARENSK